MSVELIEKLHYGVWCSDTGVVTLHWHALNVFMSLNRQHLLVLEIQSTSSQPRSTSSQTHSPFHRAPALTARERWSSYCSVGDIMAGLLLCALDTWVPCPIGGLHNFFFLSQSSRCILLLSFACSENCFVHFVSGGKLP